MPREAPVTSTAGRPSVTPRGTRSTTGALAIRRVLPATFAQHAERFVDGGLQLAVEPAQLVFRCVDGEDVGRDPEVLQVDTMVVRLRRIIRDDERTRRADAAAVDELVTAGRDHGGGSRVADDAAEAEVAERLRCDLRVRAAALIDQHYLRAGNRLAGPPARLRERPAVVPVLVGPPLQDVDQLLVDIAAAVVADVDDDAACVPELVDLLLEAHERRLVHRADVDVR